MTRSVNMYNDIIKPVLILFMLITLFSLPFGKGKIYADYRHTAASSPVR